MKFQEFNSKFFNDPDITWIGNTGFLDLGKSKVVEISLESLTVRDRYKGHLVKIIHKDNGTLSRKFFNFDDYFNLRNSTRRHGLYTGGHYIEPTVSTLSWGIATPSAECISAYTSSIYNYIKVYR